MGSAVTKYGHIAWRVIAAVAFAGTAALAVTLSRAPVRPAHAALSSHLIQSPCATSGLEAWLGLAQTAGSTSVTGTGDRLEPGGTYYTLEFTNVSARVCSLYGYPDVSAYAGDRIGGTQIGSAAAARHLGPPAAGDARARPDGALGAPRHQHRYVPADRVRTGDRARTAGDPARPGPARVRTHSPAGLL